MGRTPVTNHKEPSSSAHRLSVSLEASAIDFDDRRRALLPTLAYCCVFFALYYSFLVIPQFGVDSQIFLIDNLGGSFIVGGFVVAYFVTKRTRSDFALMLPSFGTVGAACLFIVHEEFYSAVGHLWLSAQIIGIIFAIFLGTPTWSALLFAVNVTAPPLAAALVEHGSVITIVRMQAIIYFSGIVSVYLSFSSFQKKGALVGARNEAQAAEKSKAEFLANMSHEIRTPLNGILGMLTLLKDTELSDKQQDLVATAQVSSQGLLSIINDVLDYSKIESGMMELELSRFNLRTTLEEATSLVRYRAEQKGLELRLEYPAKKPEWFVGDVTRIRQIVVNFLSNASKFTEQGSIIVHVELDDSANETTEVHIAVEDTGIGISLQHQEKLFERFSQADASTTRQYGGTGLGLSISARLSALMGGSIQVESELGKGTTFSVHLELKSERASDVRVGKPKPTAQLTSDSFPHRILVAEDNQVNQKVVRMLLKKLGYDCLIVANGEEALREVTENPERFTIVFMDIQMPVMDGLEATRKIIASCRGAHPPIVAMTANAFNQDRQHCLQAGMVDFVSKPISPNVLRQTLERFQTQDDLTAVLPNQAPANHQTRKKTTG